MAFRRVAQVLLVPLLLVAAGCLTSQVDCDPHLLPAEAAATFVGTADEATLRFALEEGGWADVAAGPDGGLRASWPLESGLVLQLVVVEESSAFGERTVVHVWGGAGLTDPAAAQRLLAPFLEPTLLYLEPHLGRPATLEYAGGVCG